MTTQILCPYCGTELKIVNDRCFCPNCGFIEKEEETNSNGDKYKGYIG